MADRAHVLLVDDELILLVAIREKLEGEGYVVHEAANALGAFETLQRHPEIGLVVSDIQMPGAGDGRALAHYIRVAKPDVPIIVVSGSGVRAEDIPGDDVRIIRKPLDMAAFTQAIRELLPPGETLASEEAFFG